MKLLNCLVGLLFMLIFSFNFVYATTYEDYNCTYPNDCALTTNYPICLNGKCRQCAPELRHKDCQCPPGDYCISDVGDTYYGYCRSKFEQNIYGRPCNSHLRNEWSQIIQGVNDSVFCGLIMFNNNLTARTLEWQGECIKGVCRECANIPITSIPVAVCDDGRSCREDGKLVILPAGVLSWGYLRYQPVMITFVAATCFTTVSLVVLTGVSIYLVCWRRKKALEDLKKE